MAKLLSGTDLAGFIKQRHYQSVQALGRSPLLAVVVAGGDAPAKAYAEVKQRYARDIGAELRLAEVGESTADFGAAIEALNQDASVDGIIVQLPLPDGTDEDQMINTIDPAKDIDGLTTDSLYDSATPTGILWLLAANNISWRDQKVTIVGQGRLVGQPLSQMMADSGAEVTRCDENTTDLPGATRSADIVVTAAGQPGLIKADMVKTDAVVVDAGSSLIDGRLVGDADPDLFEREDIAITPNPGGVGPMTVAALYDNLLRAAAQS